MKQLKFQWILNLIIVVIISTITIQIYWNYKNYETNKQQLINDVQVSLDNAVDNYYANLAKHNTMAFAIELDNRDILRSKTNVIDSIIREIDSITNDFTTSDSLRINILKNASHIEMHDSSAIQDDSIGWFSEKMIIKIDDNIDSLNHVDFKTLTSKVIYSMANDMLNIETVDSLLKEELKRKDLDLQYSLVFKSKFDSLETKVSTVKEPYLSTQSKSTYLPLSSSLEIQFSNITKTILKRILVGVFISALLVLGVIACLIFLLKIIKHQKQLAEVKNDLISNITHEFKTPIATIGVALESIKNFNAINDKEKTKNYLNMSEEQLKKLNTMVEKLLETASLDTDLLELKKESINISELIKTLTIKHQLQTDSKTIAFKSTPEDVFCKVDIFHFENAINNIIDNAVKYGGDSIQIEVAQNSIGCTINISDNENSLTEAHKNKLFEKFYRVPKGNTHDVKGFGIGLYYTKKIVENHGGVISLELETNSKTFKISIPNG